MKLWSIPKKVLAYQKYLPFAAILLVVLISMVAWRANTTNTSIHRAKQSAVNGKPASASHATNNAATTKVGGKTQQTSANASVNSGSSTTAKNSPANKTATGTAPGAHAGSSTPAIAGTVALKFSTAKVIVAGSGSSCVRLTVSSSDGEKILPPSATYYNGVLFQFPAPTSNDNRLRSSWEIAVCRANPSDTTNVNAVITSKDDSGKKYSGTLAIEIIPAPYFNVSQGALTTTDNGDSITYTANFSFVTHGSFGNPLIRMTALNSDLGCISQTPARTFNYSGQNSFTMSCTMSKSELNSNAGGGFYLRMSVQADYVAGGGDLTYLALIPAGGL